MGVFNDIGQCICRTLAGSVRIIMLIGCGLMVIMEIAGLISLMRGSDILKDIMVRSVYLNYGQTIVSIGVGLLGFHGAYKDHKPSIRVFLFGISLSILLIVGYLVVYTNSEASSDYNDKLIKPLQANQPDYDWTHKDPSPKKVSATKKWDEMQKEVMCCGIKGPEDWEKFRPKQISGNLYPFSCCFALGPESFCKEEEIFMVGCMRRVEQLESAMLITSCLYIAYQVLLLIVGLFTFCKCCFPLTGEVDGESALKSTGFRLQIAS